MQTVSRIDEWKQAHQRSLLNESFVEVSLDIADPEAIKDAKSADNGAIYISNSSLVTDGLDHSPVPYCTLEQNLWCLDGGRKALPNNDYGDNGYIGDVLSDDTCIFSSKLPVITITFDAEKSYTALVPGITITWSKTYEEFADTFEVTVYKGNTIVTSKEVTNNRSVTSIVLAEMSWYDRITITVKKWCLPNHRARVEEIFVGLHKVYGKANLFNYAHGQSVDPTSLALPKNEITFAIDNSSGEYNPHNKDGLAKYLMERQEVKARYGLKMDDGSVEWIKAGTFYLAEWYAKQNGLTAEFTGRDIFELLSDTYHDTSNYLTERSLFELAETILSTANLPLNSDGTRKWLIDESLKDIKVNVNLPEDTMANLLQLIANAGMCVLYQDRDGTLHIEPLNFEETDYEIGSLNSYSRSEISLSKPLGVVKIKAYNYGLDTSIDVNHVLSSKGETITIDNPLVTYYIDDDGLDTTYAKRVAEWVATYLKHRMTLDSSWRPDVRLDALDIVTNKNDYNSNQVCMTEVNYKFNGAFRATGKGKVISDG